jgi:DNA-binding winged helix-turn-helix (wHTH) protein
MGAKGGERRAEDSPGVGSGTRHSAKPTVRLQFDDLTFDPDSRQLWSNGTEARLSPKAFDLLSLLIERRPRAVSKADIHERLWPGTFVSDSSLPSLVSEIREAIDDHRRKPRLLRTLHGFGYAFQAPEAQAPPDAASSAPKGWLTGTTEEIALSAGENVLGREGPDVILLKSGAVSRRHARIVIDARGAVVEDLGSKNGTYVNDRRVSGPTAVNEGDQVRIGSLLFTFRSSQPASTTETLSSRIGRRPLR